MNKIRVLYVEDEPNLGKIVSETLEFRGFEVLLIRDGGAVMKTLQEFVPEICVLDIMLPNCDGLELARKIRLLHPAMPVIFLTAKTQPKDVVNGFAAGGTDYLRKPFSMEELVVRIHNQHQLLNWQQRDARADEIWLGSFRFFPNKMELHSGEKVIRLSNRESELLRILARYCNQPIDRKSLLLQIWGDDSFFHSRNLDVYIRKLRAYFPKNSGVEIITLKGMGYRFTVDAL